MRRTALVAALVTALVAAGDADAALSLTRQAFVPAVRVTGATGVFRTDVSIFNPDLERKTAVYFNYTPADGGQRRSFQLDGDLEPRETVTLVDILDLLGFSSSYGLMEVEGDTLPLIVTSNTYNIAGAVPGTYGQFSPGQPIEDAMPFADSILGDLYTPGLPFDANHRVNAVVINPTEFPLEAAVQLVDKAGFIYGTNFYDVPPFGMRQINDVFLGDFAKFGPRVDVSYRLNFFVNLGNGAKILSYTTVTDTRTGDPYLIPGQSLR